MSKQPYEIALIRDISDKYQYNYQHNLEVDFDGSETVVNALEAAINTLLAYGHSEHDGDPTDEDMMTAAADLYEAIHFKGGSHASD